MLRGIWNHLRTAEPPPLGRWCLKDKSKSDWKVDTANTDHCGTCSYENPKALTVKKSETTALMSKRVDEGLVDDK
jgi:hypothetical protein